ncbi:MAG: outer membrane lipoprotein LolB [Succinivibrionaceae bacterium]|nr:outer membrane lipoprotein LolB [Succinivibrionaceae bacterium]
MNKLINIFICTLFLSLTSCSAVYQYNDNELSLMHTDLTKAKEFKVSGKIAIIEKKRISSYININVIGDDYLIYLNDITGNTVFRLTKNDNYSEIVDSEGHIYRDNDPDKLITSLTGLVIPANSLPFILKADPMNYPHEMEDGLLKKLTYNDLEIEYVRYDVIQKLPVPTIIVIKGQNFKIKLNISNWSFNK